MKPKITALAPWFGSNRMLAHEVGAELAGCKWVGVPFAGGMTELLHIPKGATALVNDLHQHVIHLAMVVKSPELGPKLYRRLRRTPFHPYVLEMAQRFCATYDPPIGADWFVRDADARLNYAESYFISVWMGRSARAGDRTEFTGAPCIRWTGNGGSSATRFRSAATSLRDWRKVLHRCDFTSIDALKFVNECNDAAGNAIYCDPPFPGPGDKYRHKFSKEQHESLSLLLGTFKQTRVVCRFYDHPLIRELYPEGDLWTWRHLKGRDQANNGEKPEVLIINGPSYVELPST